MAGTKELEEFIEGLGTIAKILNNNLKDGFQATDVIKISLSGIKNSSVIIKGFKDMHKIKDELKDMDEVEAKKVLNSLVEYIFDVKGENDE